MTLTIRCSRLFTSIDPLTLCESYKASGLECPEAFFIKNIINNHQHLWEFDGDSFFDF